jgi:thiol-disulfide isomerase/thioredoxin
LTALALALAVLLAPPAAPISGPPKLGEALPWISGWTPDDRVLNRTRLFEERRRPLAIVLFATWCGPCEAELRALGAARKRLEKAGLDLLLVDVAEPAAPPAQWLADRGVAGVPLLVDGFGQVGRALGAVTAAGADAGPDAGGREQTTLPRTIVVDANGLVVDVFGGDGGEPVSRLLRVIRPQPPQKRP